MSVSQYVRGKVSKSKRRYVDKKNGFDLDLSYIIEKRIIAMGFPSEGMEAQYRNPYSEVIRFLEKYHRDHYKVYNLCSERGYEVSKFLEVGLFPFDDHNAPPFELLDQFCKDVHEFLNRHETNVAVIHCKAGKGRTGTVICCYMMYCGLWGTAEESMRFYAAMRTYNRKGVTIPSQIRYIYYYEQFLKKGMPPVRTLLLKKLTLFGVPRVSGALEFEVIIGGKTAIYQQTHEPVKKKKKDKKNEDECAETITFECQTKVLVHGDVKLALSEKQLLFSCWFNTGFISCQWHPEGPYNLVLHQHELDKANKDKQHNFPKGFHIQIDFDWSLQSDKEEQPKVYMKHAKDQVDLPETVQTVGSRYSDLIANFPSLNNY